MLQLLSWGSERLVGSQDPDYDVVPMLGSELLELTCVDCAKLVETNLTEDDVEYYKAIHDKWHNEGMQP